MENIYYISGIDTDCGKTVITGLLAKDMLINGINVITQKLIQTGCKGVSEDIISHRKIMGVELFDEDKEGATCAQVFSHPASPHLAADIDEEIIDINKIDELTKGLQEKYDCVLLEGAGGLIVPFNESYTSLDFLHDRGYPLILVSSSKLGSINHTLLSLEICKNKGINIAALIYNHYPNTDSLICNDSANYFRNYLKNNFKDAKFIEVPKVEDFDNINFSFKL